MIRAALVGLLAACSVTPSPLEVRAAEGGVDVIGGVGPIAVRDPDGRLVALHPRRAGADPHWVPLPAGRSVQIAVGDERRAVTPDATPVEVAVELPAGQRRVVVHGGDVVDAVVVGEAPVAGAVVLTARAPTEVALSWGDGERRVRLEAAGARARVPLALTGDARIDLRVGDAPPWSVELDVERWTADQAGAVVTVADVVLPTDETGLPDRARPPDRVTLPSPWWARTLATLGLGYRPRDDQAPWTWQTVRVRNDGEEPVNLVVRATVRDATGALAPPFASRLREARGDAVQALARVPGRGEADVSLPLFVDTSALRDPVAFVRRIDVLPLGSEVAIASVERPLFVSVGSPWASAWLVGALLTSAIGWGWLAVGARSWIARSRTEELVTVALFGSVTWVAGTALQVAGLGVAAVLGPFAPLVTGVADDALRACLLGTLVVLAPRPGTAAMATAVGFGMRALTLGSFHPVDLLYLGSAVAWLELWLWLSGCTRGEAWRDRRTEAFLRLSVGLGVANVCATATALVVSVVAYRLYFADWYVALILALPGFAYVVLGCALAVGFAAGLRRVAS